MRNLAEKLGYDTNKIRALLQEVGEYYRARNVAFPKIYELSGDLRADYQFFSDIRRAITVRELGWCTTADRVILVAKLHGYSIENAVPGEKIECCIETPYDAETLIKKLDKAFGEFLPELRTKA